MWAVRIVHEAQMWPQNSFITLTYRPEDLPQGGSLNVEHYQLFMKKLRARNTGHKIRFFHCGEYGEKLSRPHYHAILFNYDFPDKKVFSEKNGNTIYTSELLEDIWGKGFCTIGDVTFQSAAYVARYVMKK